VQQDDGVGVVLEISRLLSDASVGAFPSGGRLSDDRQSTGTPKSSVMPFSAC
jgi:hypothetical protein